VTSEAARALALAGALVALSVPAGAGTLRLLGVRRNALVGRAERYLLWTSCGLGAQAFGLTLLGLAGMFVPAAVLGLPVVMAGVGSLAVRRGVRGEDPSPYTAQPPDALRSRSASARLSPARGGGTLGRDDSDGVGPHEPGVGAEYGIRWTAKLLMVAIAVCVVIAGLAPPTDYDGLLYHLVAPRAYLAAGRIVYLPHNFSANLPAFGEMLFAVGLAGGSDRAAQLVHGAAGGLSVLLTWALGARFVSGPAGLWAAAGLAGTPLVPFLAARAYIDLFTVLFGLVALWGVLAWLECRQAEWLRVAGTGLGFALATKYAVLTLALSLGLVVVVAAATVSGAEGVRRRAAEAAVAGGWFGGLALAAALPWYARQVLELGNPVWPMYLGGRDWTQDRVEQLTYFVSQYGSGKRLLDWLLLPINVYRDSWKFGHVPASFPPLLALAVPLAWLDRSAAVRWLLALAAAVCLLWARGWQDLRYLLTIYPLLALLGAAGALAAGRRWPPARLVLALLVGVGLAGTLWREAGRAWDRVPVVMGTETAGSFLARNLDDMRAIQYLNSHVPDGDTALLLGGGQIWYCRVPCIPDPAHDNLLVWVLGYGRGVPWRGQPVDAPAAARRLAQERVSHVLLSRKDFWYLEHQDPEDRLRRQLTEFYVFKAQYLDLVYVDPLYEIYRGRW
jgi:hypothetical protein